MSTIEITDAAVISALDALAERSANIRPVLGAIGEDIVTRIKERFASASGPDGVAWKPNAPATILAYVIARGGLGKSGKINKKGVALAMGKKPLQGETRQLAQQNAWSVSNEADGAVLSVFNAMQKYAGIHQYGGFAGRGKKVFIPARPFFPLMPDGSITPAEAALVVAEIERHIGGER
ncbi:MAG: phage virion morphogenesis protein [Betaproteobacteria bacterium]|nr:phage virion morphogenesis protein [Betaproteobacteria bacterium]